VALRVNRERQPCRGSPGPCTSWRPAWSEVRRALVPVTVFDYNQDYLNTHARHPRLTKRQDGERFLRPGRFSVLTQR